MIIFDLETTGLLLPGGADLKSQPQIIEFAAVRVHPQTLKVMEQLTFLCNPGQPLPPGIVKITGIRDSDLKGQAAFSERLPEVLNLFRGSIILCGANIMFDHGMLTNELRRLDMDHRFPWPQQWWCIIEKTLHIRGHRMKQVEIYEHYCGKQPAKAHRALDDCLTCLECVRAMRKDGIL